MIKEKFQLVACNKEYWEFVRQLRNNDKVQAGFIETKYISKAEQKEYMNKFQLNYRVCLIDKKPVGYIGVIEDDIRICTHPDYQKRGIGKFMLKEAFKIWPNAHAKIKESNLASKKLFESAGFELQFVIMKRK
tara:strand:- start:90 stop:488 length:399 start_codon:yes stop_codon:yes gene_type:complete